MERIVIRRRGGFVPTELEIWIGDYKVERVVGYQVTERSKSIPQVTLTLEADEIIEELEFADAELRLIGEVVGEDDVGTG